MRAVHASVLREADTAVGREVASLNLTDGRLNQTAVFASLLVRDGCFQILNFRDAFPDKDHNGYIANSADPGVANHLGIERQQSRWFLRVAAGRGFPVDQALRTVEFAEG